MDESRTGIPLGFEIVFRPDGDCLVAEVNGWIETVDALIAMFVEISGHIRERQYMRLLVLDHTEGTVPSEQEMKKLMIAMEGRGVSRVRVAYVDMRGTAVHRMEVGEILGREHGYDCRVFDNEQRARIWLHYGDD
jgi:hypothetical protein